MSHVKTIVCPSYCGGHGWFEHSNGKILECRRCNGDGVIEVACYCDDESQHDNEREELVLDLRDRFREEQGMSPIRRSNDSRSKSGIGKSLLLGGALLLLAMLDKDKES